MKISEVPSRHFYLLFATLIFHIISHDIQLEDSITTIYRHQAPAICTSTRRTHFRRYPGSHDEKVILYVVLQFIGITLPSTLLITYSLPVFIRPVSSHSTLHFYRKLSRFYGVDLYFPKAGAYSDSTRSWLAGFQFLGHISPCYKIVNAFRACRQTMQHCDFVK